MAFVKILGDGAEEICLGITGSPSSWENSKIITEPDVLILTENVRAPLEGCKMLIIPDTLTAIPPNEITICCGMSSKCTVTLSSMGEKPVLAIQREIISVQGKSIEPQEIPLANPYKLSGYPLMASSAALLVLGLPPERLS